MDFCSTHCSLHNLSRQRKRAHKKKTGSDTIHTNTEQIEKIWTPFEFDKYKIETEWNIIHREICCKKLQEKYAALLSDKDKTINKQQKTINYLRKEIDNYHEQKGNKYENFKRTKGDFEQDLLERDEKEKRSSKVLLAEQSITDNHRQTISTLKEELRKHKAETVIKLNIADKALKIATFERDAAKQRCENLLDTIESLTKKQSALHKENTVLRTRLQDIKIHFKEWNSISVKVSSALNPPDESTYDVEKENETLKENLKKVEHDKQRLEQELSITLTKLLQSREKCHGRSKRYSKETHDMETNTIAEVSNETNKSPAVDQYHDKDSRMLKSRGKENTSKTLVERSTNEPYQNITSEKNIYQITASNVYMIDKSTVSGVGFSSSIQGSECNEPLLVNEPLKVKY